MGVGPRRVGDEQPDVDLQVERSLTLGGHEIGRLVSALPGVIHSTDCLPCAH